jgi:hypothetical protein
MQSPIKTQRRDLDTATIFFFCVSSPQRTNYNGMKIKFIREVFAGDFPKDITVMRSRYYDQPLNEYMHRLATHFNFERTPEMRTALLSHLGKSLLNMAQNKTDPGKIKLKNVKAREKRNQ